LIFVLSFADLAGCVDGSIYLLNWSQENSQRQLREPSKRVTKIELSNEGNKVIEKQLFLLISIDSCL